MSNQSQTFNATQPPQDAAIDQAAQQKAETKFYEQKRAEGTFIDFMKLMARKTVTSQMGQKDLDDDKTIVRALYHLSQENAPSDVSIIIFRTFITMRDRINDLEYKLSELAKQTRPENKPVDEVKA